MGTVASSMRNEKGAVRNRASGLCLRQASRVIRREVYERRDAGPVSQGQREKRATNNARQGWLDSIVLYRRERYDTGGCVSGVCV